MPEFNEQDPDAIFIFLNVLQVPPVSHMQCVLAERTQEALSAVCSYELLKDKQQLRGKEKNSGIV